MNKLSGGRVDAKKIPHSGPAPVLIRYTELAALIPDWERITADIEADPEAVKQLDWVREMYAWDIALALHNITLDTETPPHSRLIAQPPHDLTIGDAAMFHYTWCVPGASRGCHERRWTASREGGLALRRCTWSACVW
jgi:hypothetical protein